MKGQGEPLCVAPPESWEGDEHVPVQLGSQARREDEEEEEEEKEEEEERPSPCQVSAEFPPSSGSPSIITGPSPFPPRSSPTHSFQMVARN